MIAALLVVLSLLGGLVVGSVLLLRWFAAATWRSELVSFELRFARELEASDVVAALTGLSGTLAPRWRRALSARAVMFEAEASEHGIVHRVLLPRSLSEVVLPQLRAALPGVSVSEAEAGRTQRPLLAGELALNTSSRPLRVDAPAHISRAILASLQPLDEGESVTVQWIEQPVGPVDLTRVPAHWGPKLDAATQRGLRDKQAAPLFQSTARLGVVAADQSRARQLLQRSTAAFHTANAPGVHLYRRRVPSCQVARAMARRVLPLVRYGGVYNARELAGLIALPIGDPQIPGLAPRTSRQLAPNRDIPAWGRIVAVSNFAGPRASARAVCRGQPASLARDRPDRCRQVDAAALPRHPGHERRSRRRGRRSQRRPDYRGSGPCPARADQRRRGARSQRRGGNGRSQSAGAGR